MDEQEQLEQSDMEVKPESKKKNSKALPVLIGFLAVGMMGFAVWQMTNKGGAPKEKPPVRQVVQATKQQVEAVRQEAGRLEKIDKVDERPFSQIGTEPGGARDIWDELKREAEREQRERSIEEEQRAKSPEADRMMSAASPGPNHRDIVREVKVNLGDESENVDRRVYSSGSKKEQLETEKEEYSLERTSMFAYSRSYEKAAYVEKTSGPASPSSLGNGLSNSEDAYSEDIEAKKQVRYNNNPSFLIGIGDILDAVVTHKIVNDTRDSPVVCNVSKDLLDDTGEWVLIPSGSRVIGRAAQVSGVGAHRLFIYFQKIVLPSGVTIDLPPLETVGLDTEGSQGVVSSVDRHFMLKFGTAFLVGLLDGLGGLAQSSLGQNPQAGFFIDRSSSNFKEVNKEILQQYGNIPPTITIHPGHRMKIYFPRTIEISGYEKARNRAYGRVR